MGTVISRNAPPSEILSDAATTVQLARARGGVWQIHAEARLVAVLVLDQRLGSELESARTELAPLLDARREADAIADAEIGRVADEIWTAIGRPAYDPTLSLVFPGGVAHYTESGVDELPLRMDLLAGLLDQAVISKLDRDTARELAGRIRAVTRPLRLAIDALILPRARVALLERERTALASVAQMELAHLKRVYKSEGFSETDIHQVIPSRKRQRGTMPPPR